MKVARSFEKLNITQRTGVGIMGFNSPYWIISFTGSI